jgi:hypothetical protein
MRVERKAGQWLAQTDKIRGAQDHPGSGRSYQTPSSRVTTIQHLDARPTKDRINRLKTERMVRALAKPRISA